MLRPNCDFFEIIDWDIETEEILHAVCTDHNPAWPKCSECKGIAEHYVDDAVCKCCGCQAAGLDGLCSLCSDIAPHMAEV